MEFFLKPNGSYGFETLNLPDTSEAFHQHICDTWQKNKEKEPLVLHPLPKWRMHDPSIT